jgi:CheY-like chemotaxis protein
VGYKILLADDSVTVQKIITLTFSDEGVDVLTVNNGDEAISRLQYMRPALVMADVSIPGRNGYEICEFIKNHPELRETPVVLLVPAFEPFDEDKARRVGADHFLTKPFQSIRTLISTVKSLIEPGNRKHVMGLQEERLSANGEGKQTSDLEPVEVLDLTDEEITSQSVRREGDGFSSGSEDFLPNSRANVIPISSGKHAGSSFPETTQVIEGDLTAGARAANPPSSWQSLEEDSDHVLELDDVLADLWVRPETQSVITEIEETEPSLGADEVSGAFAGTTSNALSQNLSFTLPEAVVDEIVSRVVAQVTEKLPELLSREIAGRIAPEVIEIIKQQQLAGKVAYHEPDSLLELDEV